MNIPTLPNNSTRRDITHWCLALLNEGILYHFDDNPRDIINTKTGKRIFNEKQAKQMDKLADQIFSINGIDPFRSAIAAMRYYNIKHKED